ncbi:MAG: DMT family transporter [Chloroflexota bacterium]
MVPPKITSSTPTSPQKIKETPQKHDKPSSQALGLFWAMLSPVFLGTVPILAKLAFEVNVPLMTLVAFRTISAALILWVAILVFAPSFITSSKPAIIGSLIAGSINGFGSIFFYASLTQIDASLGQLINITYLVFVTVLLRLAGQSVSFLTLARTGLTIFAIFLLTVGSIGEPNWLGVGMMLVAALMYAIQLVLSQRIMLDIPAPTMTLYAMTAMAAVVTVAWLFNPTSLSIVSPVGWQIILAMGLATALARLTLFLGVKSLGSLQTALLGVFEVIVTIGIANFLLDEQLTLVQWVGAAILIISILLVRYERDVPKFFDWWQYIWRWIYR